MSFCRAYGVRGSGGDILRRRQRGHVAVHRGGAREDQAPDPRVARRHEQVQRGVDIRPVAEHRFRHRPRHRWDGCLVQHVVRARRCRVRDLRVREVALDELDSIRDCREVLDVPGDETVDDAHAFAPAHQFLDQVRSDEPRPARHQVMCHRLRHDIEVARPIDKAIAPQPTPSQPNPRVTLRRAQRAESCPRLRAQRSGEATTIPLVPSSLTGSSDRPGGLERAALITPPYLVLLRAGFCLPPALPRARCALTAPFHPYPPPLSTLRTESYGAAGPTGACLAEARAIEGSRAKAGGIFSVPLSFRSP